MTERRIKILFVSSWYPSRVNPTLGNFVQKHAEAVAAYAEVCVLHVCFEKRTGPGKTAFVFTEEKTIRNLHAYCKKTSNPLVRILRYLKAYNRGLQLIRSQWGEPDVIHANVLFPLGLIFLLSKKFRTYPFVFTEHWVGYLPQYPLHVSVLNRTVSRIIARKSRFLLPVSGDLQKGMERSGLKGNYRVIPNVVDEAFFQQGSAEARTPGQKFRFLHVSGLDDRQKNVTGMIRAVHELSRIRKDFEMAIVTDGDPEKFRKQAAAAGLPDSVLFFRDKQTPEELAISMRASDCFVLFSYYETFAIVLAESLATGTPVIATDAGGVAGDLNAGHGILITPGDEKALVRAMDYMIDHRAEFDTEILTTFAEQYKASVIGKAFLDIYHQCLNRLD